METRKLTPPPWSDTSDPVQRAGSLDSQCLGGGHLENWIWWEGLERHKLPGMTLVHF